MSLSTSVSILHIAEFYILYPDYSWQTEVLTILTYLPVNLCQSATRSLEAIDSNLYRSWKAYCYEFRASATWNTGHVVPLPRSIRYRMFVVSFRQMTDEVVVH